MSHVVCLMNVDADRATFTWSEGPASFEPFTLDGMVYKDFQEVAAEAREKLANLVKDYLFDEQNMPQSAFELAEAGHELYQALFDPGADQARQAKQVRSWLEQLAEQHEVDTLEVVVESPWSLPWNIIYDRQPDKAAFLAGDESPARWKPFWGLRYNLAGGRKVDPLRRMPLLDDPKVLLVVDPEIRDGLPEEQQRRLAEFAETRKLRMVHSKDALQEAITAERPDFLYWLSHAAPDALVLAGEEISPRNMRKLLRQDDDENFGGLAFLNACRTAEGGELGSFFEAFHNVGFAGMIGTEHQTVDQFANPLGLDFLEAFLDRGEPVGSALRKLRGRVPLGLLYGTYCPPEIRVDRGNVHDSMEIQQVHVEGVALSAQPAMQETATQTLPPLPDEPYRSLAYYDREDRALFAGREDDIERFATMLDDAATRILVLHGESGVGKSSFLHAGVIPYLEEECLGYRFVRNWKDGAATGGQGSVIFVRATNDLFGQLAQALWGFCAQPYEYDTPLGEKVLVNLPELLAEFLPPLDAADLVPVSKGGMNWKHGPANYLQEVPSLLGRILSAISDRLPFSAILVIDQGEEVFTLAQTPEDQQRGRQALDMLRRTVGASGDFRVIFSLRTEYYGRVIDRLRRGLHAVGSIREYLLTDFGEAELVEAIRRPTADETIPYTSEVPLERYGFRYATGVAEEIARSVVRYTTQRRDSVLPLMQVICAQLSRLAGLRADKTITLADLKTLGGIEGGMRNHVEGLLGELLKDRPLDKRPLQRLFTQLYLKQPDGTLTTALLAEDEVGKRWTGRMPFGELLQACAHLRLLKVNTLRIGSDEERRYVSLGHDALAKLASTWDVELSRSRIMRRIVATVATVSAVAIVMAGLAVWSLWSMRRAVKSEESAVVSAQVAVKSKEKADAAKETAVQQEQLAQQALAESREKEALNLMQYGVTFCDEGDPLGLAWLARAYQAAPDGSALRASVTNLVGGWFHDSFGDRLNLPNEITAATYSEDGALLAIGDIGGTVSWWDAETKTKIFEERNVGEVRRLEFSPGGNELRSLHRKQLHVWNVVEKRHERQREIGTHDKWLGGPWYVQHDPSDSEKDKILHERFVQPVVDSVPGEVVAITPDGSKAALRYVQTLGLADGQYAKAWQFQFWDLNTGKPLSQLLGAFQPHSRFLEASLDPEGKLLVIPLDQSPATFTFGDFRIATVNDVVSVDWADDRVLVRDGDFRNPQYSLRYLNGLSSPIPFHTRSNAAALRPGRPEMFIGGMEGDGYFRKLRSSRRVAEEVCNALAFVRDARAGHGQILAAGAALESELLRLSPLDGEPDRIVEPTVSAIVALSPNGQSTLTGGDTFRLTSLVPQRELISFSAEIAAYEFSPDGNTLATWGADASTIDIWNCQDGQQVGSVQIDDSVGHLAVTSDRRYVVTVAPDANGAVLWDVATGGRRDVPPHDQPITSLAVSPRNDLLATAGKDRTVQLRSFEDGSVRTLVHSHPLVAVCFSNDGRTVASVAGQYGYVAQLWDSFSGHPRGRSFFVNVPLAPLRFSPDDTRLAIAQPDGIHLWPVGNFVPTEELDKWAVQQTGYAWDEQRQVFRRNGGFAALTIKGQEQASNY